MANNLLKKYLSIMLSRYVFYIRPAALSKGSVKFYIGRSIYILYRPALLCFYITPNHY
jgi:hypothetical protein